MNEKAGAGIRVSGRGSITADVIAVGQNARAMKTVREAGHALDERGLNQLHEALDTFIQTLNAHASKLADQETVLALTEKVGAELRRENPDKLTLKGFIAAIAEEAKPVVEIATAAVSLGKLIATFL
jgi:hypothetical protein